MRDSMCLFAVSEPVSPFGKDGVVLSQHAPIHFSLIFKIIQPDYYFRNLVGNFDSDMATQAGLTCITCRLQFDDAQIMRDHYKKEFHRFNLKRKGLSLPPVPESLYDQKVAGMTNSHFKPVINTCLAAGSIQEENKGSQHLKQGKARKEKAPASPEPTPAEPIVEKVQKFNDIFFSDFDFFLD